jgi:hypothetical protein
MGMTMAWAVLALVAGTPASADQPGGSPVGVVRAFYWAASQGRCDAAAAYFTPDSIRAIERSLGAEGFRSFCAARAGRTPLETVLLRKVDIRGTEAEIVTERRYQDGSAATETRRLVKSEGAWHIVVGDAEVPPR